MGTTIEARDAGREAILPVGLAIASLGAAGIHFAVMGEHYDEYLWFGVFFTAAAWLQALWALAVVAAPSRSVLIWGLVGNLAVVALWTITRTVGLPIGPEPGQAEALGWSDAVSGVLELAIAAGCTVALARGSAVPRIRRRTTWALVGALALVTAFVTTAALVSGSGGDGHGTGAHMEAGAQMNPVA